MHFTALVFATMALAAPLDRRVRPGGDISVTPGNCGVHVTQFQKPNPATDNYKLDIRMFDGAQKLIGVSNGQENAPSGQGVVVTNFFQSSDLTVTAQNVDDDPLLFSFQAQNFDSNSGQCSVGAYDSGKREMDCGFSCVGGSF
ncbi:hypothetical protein DL96DRAFT_1585129 [Flagelloscypha sp. PMI_526]|nr:hypothetical protein DL96DRAFT_1585129 [Flagelloscypha sp. PMI_526]